MTVLVILTKILTKSIKGVTENQKEMSNCLADLKRDNLEMKKSMRPMVRQADDFIDHKSTSGSAF